MDIFEEVKKLDFPLGAYVVVGSGPMAARGIKEVKDIDIVVTPELFENCKKDGWEQIPWTYPEKLGQFYLRKGVTELYLDVNRGNFNPTFDELIQKADIINGVVFASLNDVVKFKKAYNRPKHDSDILLIEKYLRSQHLQIPDSYL